MLEKIRVVFTIPELRYKILLTLFLLLIFRVGWHIPLPFIDASAIRALAEREEGWMPLLEQVAIFSASDLSNATIFGLGIMPYISASIIFQLLSSVYPPLEKLRKEGESGRRKINEYTRYATIAICLLQSWFFLGMMIGQGFIHEDFLVGDRLPFRWHITAVLTMTAGTAFLMWLGEQIDEYGIGNGISLLIMAGILARMPDAFMRLLAPMIDAGQIVIGGGPGMIGVDRLLVLAVVFVLVIAGVVFITLGQRRIPTQSAKHVRGRRVFGGTRQFLPLKVNQAGVMPIIFASSLLLLPMILFGQLYAWQPESTLLETLAGLFRREDSFMYNLFYIGLIYFFCYFWTAITFNPNDIADNLKNYGSFIPGYRPGRRTAEYLEKVMVRITYVGAGFLSLVAIFPTLVAQYIGVDFVVAQFFGGTGLLIAVSVAFDLVQKIDSHLVMRNYRGLLEK